MEWTGQEISAAAKAGGQTENAKARSRFAGRSSWSKKAKKNLFLRRVTATPSNNNTRPSLSSSYDLPIVYNNYSDL